MRTPLLGTLASQISGKLVTSSFESIASATGTGSSGTITFSSIPSTYTSLQIRIMCQDNDSALGNISLQINGDTATNYTRHYLNADGASVTAVGSITQSNILGSQVYGNNPASSITGVIIWDIHNYASTSQYKTVRTFGGYDSNGAGNIRLTSGLWQSTSAITSLSFFLNSGGNWSNKSVFALYGIKGA